MTFIETLSLSLLTIVGLSTLAYLVRTLIVTVDDGQTFHKRSWSFAPWMIIALFVAVIPVNVGGQGVSLILLPFAAMI